MRFTVFLLYCGYLLWHLPGRFNEADTCPSDSCVSTSRTFLAQLTTCNEHMNLKITTMSKVTGGIPGLETPLVKVSMEFAIAPMKDEDTPLLDQAFISLSDNNGEFELNVPTGIYWIGSKERAINRKEYKPGTAVTQEVIVEVKEGKVSKVDLLRTGYAP